MKQVWYAAKDTIEVRDVPEPTPGYGEIKVKVAYAALCATDIHMVTMGILGAKPPRPLGHEASGVVAELGPFTESSGLKVGDKVVVNTRGQCGMCVECKSGRGQYCLNAKPPAAFAEYLTIHASAVYKVPDDADLKHYALIEPMACCIRAMDLAAIRHGETVLLSGCGGIGMILLNMILLSGAASITVSEPVAGKRETALAMGAQYAIDPLKEDFVEKAMEITNGQGFDHIFEASGVASTAVPCTKAIAKCGKITYFAVFSPSFEMPLNLYELYRREASVQTVFSSPSIFPRAIRLMPRTQMDKVVGAVVPLANALDAFDLFRKSIYPKIILECQP
ncbi:MAG: alcohol dehydrogenase catalytic domain-containing protein [Clostridiales bacterium]|nr:alcohol dehydrogenase catalytic domain-containing protein [Clostridiales bacterium]